MGPGPDTALVTKNGLIYGRRASIATAFGVVTGLLVWTLAAALGVAAIVHASATAFTVMKLAGAAYLIWLGIQALRAAGRSHAAEQGDASGGAIFAALTLTWLVAFALMASKAGGLLTRPRVKAGLDRLTGVVLIGLGLRLATEQR